MKQFVRFIERVMACFSPIVMGMGIALVVVPFFPARGQISSVATQVHDIDNGVKSLERRVQDIESLQIDHRLTVLEQIGRDSAKQREEAQSTTEFSRYSTVGIGLLLCERCLGFMRTLARELVRRSAPSKE